MDQHEKELFGNLPDDHSAQVDDWSGAGTIKSWIPELGPHYRILDLGAGSGASKDRILSGFDEGTCTWVGVDIDDSAEAIAHAKNKLGIIYYDGVNLPFDDGEFDAIWCRQVLEHVRYPDEVLKEVARCLKPNGVFIGSVSQLEPYHSRSIFNWTHYGIKTVFEDHGLNVKQMRPGIDGILLIVRRLFGRRTNLSRFFRTESPIGTLIEQFFVTEGSRSTNVKVSNFHKLTAAGHIHFVAKKD